MEAEVLTVRAGKDVKARLRRLQGRLQTSYGRNVTMQEVLAVALASVEAQWPVSIEPVPDEIAARLALASVETSRPAPRRPRKSKEKDDAAA